MTEIMAEIPCAGRCPKCRIVNGVVIEKSVPVGRHIVVTAEIDCGTAQCDAVYTVRWQGVVKPVR